ncbi:MAG: hypothetical protein K6U14_04995 [Firmicutes bacterium]|nr:hypothetical protein [Alicyclobacillaceae bacterium]MCL6496978.1 hypothetical protein [Bacillota bacterium]
MQAEPFSSSTLPSWSPPPRRRPPRLLTQAVAALVLFSLVRGGLDRLGPPWRAVLSATVTRWLNWNTPLPPTWRAVLPALGGPVGTAPPSMWPPPVRGAFAVMERYGWQGTGLKAAFFPGVRIAEAAGAPVRSGPGGMVVTVASGPTGATVVERVTPTVAVAFVGLGRASVKVGERVGADAAIGVAGSRPWTLEVWVRGIPTDPLAVQYFGALWPPAGTVRR